MINGILLINKERDITSYDVIRKLKRVLPKGQKIGHGGTLDPFATGLLIILLGRGTKLMNKIHSLKKDYVVKAEFGYSTDTQDITGEKDRICKDLKEVSKSEIERRIKEKFLGEILQTPPMFSAKKIKGKKAYELARKGEEVKIEPKKVEIYSFDLVDYDWPYSTFSISCSTGTYVRTLIHDLGVEISTYGTAIELERKKIGDFKLEDAFNSKDIVEENVDKIVGNVINLENLKL
ncbi:MAG: tRNA pseudouridine(55) synthase TruB [Candidatus Dojkabacteria bacterium]|jgi:tRNA pseudouridine55 synthase